MSDGTKTRRKRVYYSIFRPVAEISISVYHKLRYCFYARVVGGAALAT